MGHIGEKGLRAMHNKCMVEGFLDCNLEVNFCEHCWKTKSGLIPIESDKGKIYSRIDT
jgi:hypothetical protein